MPPIETQLIVKKVDGREMRIVLNWRGTRYVLGKFVLLSDGSFVYMHEALNRPDVEAKVSLGALRQNGVFLDPVDDPANSVLTNSRGIHVSLHPRATPEGTGIFHVRAHSDDGPSKTIARKSLNWEPVKTIFTVFVAISPPMAELARYQRPAGDRITDCIVDVPEGHAGSVRMPVDVLPFGTPTVPLRHGSLGNFFGTSGVRFQLRPEVTMTPATPGILIWPEDGVLSLIP